MNDLSERSSSLQQMSGASTVSPGPNQLALPELGFDPSQATSRGRRLESLHRWFPFIESYSPQYVEDILGSLAPNAQRVLDPFSGVGTTPLVSIRMGLQAFYCEVNPLLQYLTQVKIRAHTLESPRRAAIVSLLRQLSRSFEGNLEQVEPDADLALTYSDTFGSSEFFDQATFDQVLRARSVVDELACTDPDAADFVCVAILCSLVLASRLKRAGDLRFKRPAEVERQTPDFPRTVATVVSEIAEDLETIRQIESNAVLVCEDAKNLGRLPPLDVDTVITSPPYLNGTNYFRNTKIELWFLRCLRQSSDLREFRTKAITAGINDVNGAKHNGTGVQFDLRRSPFEPILQRLTERAYDSRIPRMVEGYFHDLYATFSGLVKHLRPHATVTIDLGDSIFAGVHIPTDLILIELLQSLGFKLQREVRLRRRFSRTGLPLKHCLLLLSCEPRLPSTRPTPRPKRPHWLDSCRAFRQKLPHQEHPYAKRNWGHPLHSLCSYQGKMKASLAHHLVKTFVPERGKLLDPFAGVGTIPFEGALQGHEVFAFEISPAARAIAAAKLGRPSAAQCDLIVSELDSYIQANNITPDDLRAAQEIAFNRNLTQYFHPKTLAEILLARRFFNQRPPQRAADFMVLASLLHILHGNRPYALSRRSHSITPFAPSGPFDYRPLIPHLRKKLTRSLLTPLPESFVPGKVFFQDSTSWWPNEVHQLDTIITSPPFFDSTRFYLANWLRLWFCGWDRTDFKSRPLSFVDERQKSSFRVYEAVLRQARERLKSGGVVVLHLGRSRKCDMATELARIASPWFRVVDHFAESVTHCESHGIRDKGTVEAHQYLILQ